MPTVRGTHTKFSAQFCLFTVPTATAAQFPTTKIFAVFSLSYNYETYADGFVRLCEIKYLMFVFTLLIPKVKSIQSKTGVKY